jgi:hypothetical protein
MTHWQPLRDAKFSFSLTEWSFFLFNVNFIYLVFFFFLMLYDQMKFLHIPLWSLWFWLLHAYAGENWLSTFYLQQENKSFGTWRVMCGLSGFPFSLHLGFPLIMTWKRGTGKRIVKLPFSTAWRIFLLLLHGNLDMFAAPVTVVGLRVCLAVRF